jgi:excisionase family DNA binding protein
MLCNDPEILAGILKGGMAMTKLVSVEESAYRLGISSLTVRRLVKCGRLRSTRIGRRLLLPETEIARIANEGCELPAVSGAVTEAVQT